MLVDKAEQADLLAEGELRLARVPQVGEQPLRLAGRLLHAVEQRREARLPLVEAGATKDRDGHEERRPRRRARGAHDLAQELRSEPRRSQCAAAPSGNGMAAHEEQDRLPRGHELRAHLRRPARRLRAASQQEPRDLPDRPPPHRRHAGREARERQALAPQHRVHQQIVDRRAVPHHVDHGALCRQLADALDELGTHAHLREGEADEEPREQAESLEHGRSLGRRTRRLVGPGDGGGAGGARHDVPSRNLRDPSRLSAHLGKSKA